MKRPDALVFSTEVPIMVLSDTVLFPHSLLPLHIHEEKYRRMLDWSLEHSRVFGIATPLQQRGFPSDPLDIEEVMGIGLVRACVGKPDGTSDLILHGLERVLITGVVQTEPFRIVRIIRFITLDPDEAKSQELAKKIIAQSCVLAQSGHRISSEINKYLECVNNPEVVGDLLASFYVQDPVLRQEILETACLPDRLEQILSTMKALTTTGGG